MNVYRGDILVTKNTSEKKAKLSTKLATEGLNHKDHKAMFLVPDSYRDLCSLRPNKKSLISIMKMNKILQALFILLFSVQFATAQSYNTLTATDKPVSVVLSDKSKVCVNHAGTIVYPSAFSKKQNTIEIKGEAYVEVHSAALKAITVDDLIVKGLPGAGFNIAAYEKDSIIKITAVEKSITIKAGSKTFLLHAGEQVLINRNHEITIQQVNVSEVISWMNQIKKEKGK